MNFLSSYSIEMMIHVVCKYYCWEDEYILKEHLNYGGR